MMLFRNKEVYYANSEKPDDKDYVKFFQHKRPTEDCDWFLAKRKHFAFFPKFLYDGYEDLAWINSFFHKLKQPSEQEVRRAMILTIQDDCGDGPMNKYMLKAGGGSVSDSVFVSSYSIVTADPSTGLDTWRVIMKKYSCTFEDVLISYDEIKHLFDQVATPEQVNADDKDSAIGYIGLFIRAKITGKIHFSDNKFKPATKANLDEIVSHVRSTNVINFIPEAIDFFRKKINDSMKREFVEDKPGRNITLEHRQDEARRLKALDEIEKMFSGSVHMQTAGPQLDLFAAA